LQLKCLAAAAKRSTSQPGQTVTTGSKNDRQMSTRTLASLLKCDDGKMRKNAIAAAKKNQNKRHLQQRMRQSSVHSSCDASPVNKRV
jgi:hypothetical protein